MIRTCRRSHLLQRRARIIDNEKKIKTSISTDTSKQKFNMSLYFFLPTINYKKSNIRNSVLNELFLFL